MTDKRNHNHPSNRTVIPFIPNANYYFEKGVSLFYQRAFDDAIKWMKKAIEADSSEPLYQMQLSVVYTETGKYHLANQILTDLLDKYQDKYLELFYLLANNYAHLGLLTDAEKYAAKYLDKAPEGEFRSETEQLLTLLELGLTEVSEEIAFTQDDEILIYQETAFHHLQRRNWSEACTVLAEMIKRFPNYLLAKQQYHYALFFSGEQKEALEQEEKLFKKNQQSTYTKTNLLIFYYEQGMLKEVELFVEKLENIYPLHIELALRVAISFAHVKQFEKAYRRFCPLPTEKLKNHLEYYRYFAETCYRLNYQTKAEQIWTEGCRRHSELTKEPLPWSSD